MNKHYIIAGTAAVIIAGGSFYGGTIYAKRTTSERGQLRGQGAAPLMRMNGQGGAGAQIQFRGGTTNGGFTAGEVIATDDKSITVKLADGGSKVVFVAESTKVTKTTDGSITDVAQGKNIVVMGTANADGSVTAATIQLRPTGTMMMPMGEGRMMEGRPVDAIMIQP